VSADARTDSSRARVIDRVGVIIVAIGIGWVLVTAGRAGSNPWPDALLLTCATIMFVLGRALGRRWPVELPAGVAGATFVLTFGLVWPPWPMDGYAYGNANGAFLAQGVCAAILGSVSAVASRARILFICGAIALLLMTGATRSLTATLVAGIAVAIGLIGPRLRTLTVTAGLLTAPWVVVGLTLLVAGGVLPAWPDERRATLWREALNMLDKSLWTGVGPGQFGIESPTGLVDADARWAHSLAIEQGADAVGCLYTSIRAKIRTCANRGSGRFLCLRCPGRCRLRRGLPTRHLDSLTADRRRCLIDGLS
jgi:hypothetical protein